MTVSLEPTDGVDGAKRHIVIPRFLPNALRYPFAVPRVRRIIRRYRPHIVNSHFLPNYGVIAALTGFRPCVLSTWGSDIMMLPQRTAFHMRRTRFVIQRASFITSDAQVMSERLVELGASEERIVTFPYGVDRDVFHPRPPGPEREGPRVLSNRKLEAVYSIETLLTSFSPIAQSAPGASLTIAGTGSHRERLRSAARHLGLADSTRFVGGVSHADMPELLRDHDLYVSVALSDTTSVSLLEAMACGLFPIVSDIPANKEWIEHGKNGFLVPVQNARELERAIVSAWQDGQLRSAAREHNARIIEERADWYSNMAVVGELFDRLLSDEKPGA
jgi:glycosyltransferase involved in cell wall biosynthesis